MKDELPDFLRRFHPDLIAVGPDRSVVVEVKAPGKVRRSDYWREIAEAVRSHQGWHLEIVPNGSAEPQEESISEEEIRGQLARSAALAEAGDLGASLLIAWSSAEAALRLIAERFDVSVSNLSPQSLINRLFSDGLMDREDYDVLVALMRTRNAVAHGFRQQVTREDLARLREVVHHLLAEQEE